MFSDDDDNSDVFACFIMMITVTMTHVHILLFSPVAGFFIFHTSRQSNHVHSVSHHDHTTSTCCTVATI